MRKALAFCTLLCCATPLFAQTSVESGVRVHRAEPAGGDDRRGTGAPAVSIRLDSTYGARPSCVSMDWRLSVSREAWEARCGDAGYERWYDRWIYRSGY